MTALRNRLAPIRGIPTKSGGLKVSFTCARLWVRFTLCSNPRKWSKHKDNHGETAITAWLCVQDPNADINEMFDMVEQVASAPKKFFDNMFKK